MGRVIDRDWRLFSDRRVVHFAYFYLLWLVIQSAARYGKIAGDDGPTAFAAHLAHALIEPYSTLWFIYLLAVFSVVTKALRRVPDAVLLAGAAVLQIADIRSESTLIEEFWPDTSSSSPAICSPAASSPSRTRPGTGSGSPCAASPHGRSWKVGSR